MGFVMRDKDRYGKYHVYVPEVGNCVFEIDISGFGESFTLSYFDRILFTYDTEENDYVNFIEVDDGFCFDITSPVCTTVYLKWNDMVKF